jgi:SAM-dependent methyltransferase
MFEFSDHLIGPCVDFIFDGHDIPFKNEVFDCVIIQAVLEHVLDPYRCVNEIHRVLKSSGIVYAETPFMQQVHMKQYDFTRFTNLGHIRLFRSFTELDSGPTAGPGVALAWSISYFLKSFFSSRFAIEVVTALSRFIVFPLKYIDYYLLNRPGGYDAASGFFFVGRKSKNQLTDRELIKKFKGNIV